MLMLISNGPSHRPREIPGGNCMGHIEIHRSSRILLLSSTCMSLLTNSAKLFPRMRVGPRAQSPMRHC